MAEDEEVGFRFSDDGGDMAPGMPDGPVTRENVDIGVGELNLTVMRDELEALRRKKQGGG
jgi:hypothetical protein